MFFLIDNLFDIISFKDNTLVIPAISVGNVGQLASDLLISTFGCTKVGYFCPTCFLPVIGNNPFTTSKEDKSTISLNCEVYSCLEKKLTVIQIRSPLVKGKQEVFRKSLLEWFGQCQFKELVVLSSCHAYERTDEQLVGTSFRYHLTSSAKNMRENFNCLNWKELEVRKTGYGDKTLFLPGGGYTKKLFEDCCEANVAAVVLFIYCSEGDNIPEAITLVQHLNEWKRYLEPPAVDWKQPSSWKHLFGNPPPEEIF